MFKKSYKKLIMILGSQVFLILCCLFAAIAGSGDSGIEPTATGEHSFTPITRAEKQTVVETSYLASPTYTSTPTAVNALTPTTSPTPIPTGTAVTPFLLPTKVPTKTFAPIVIDLDDYYPSTDYDYQTDDATDVGVPSAICRDGTVSYSAHRRGTCSHHGGVAQWLR